MKWLIMDSIFLNTIWTFAFPVSETYLQLESNSEDVFYGNMSNMSNATSNSSVCQCGELNKDDTFQMSTEIINTDVVVGGLTSLEEETPRIVTKTKSKMFFNFGSKKEKQKDII